MVDRPTLPHLPRQDDPVREMTYVGVGRFIDCWESVEFELSRTFSAAMGHLDGRIIPFYGEEGKIFRERIGLLKLAVDHHFIVSPDQDMEARFDQLVEDVSWVADRRNDVAHTVVLDLSSLMSFARLVPPPTSGAHHFAVPPLYAFTRRAEGRGKSPPFAFSSAELDVLCQCATDLLVECRKFRHDLFPGEWPDELRA